VSPTTSLSRRRENAKGTRCWVCTAVDGDRNRGKGILNNPLNIGQVR
jgi:hypothetical protein